MGKLSHFVKKSGFGMKMIFIFTLIVWLWLGLFRLEYDFIPNLSIGTLLLVIIYDVLMAKV